MHPSPHSHTETASAWVQRWAHLVPAGGSVLDVACGSGRHLRWFADLDHPVVGVDRSVEALASIGLPPERCQIVQADIEGSPWPLTGRLFAAVVVTNYLWRPLLPTLLDSLAEGGVMIYETFASGHETIGRPSRPDFLLKPGELLKVFEDLRVVAFEDGYEDGAGDGVANGAEVGPNSSGPALAPARTARSPRFVQRIAAVRQTPWAPGAAAREPARYRLR